MADAQRIGRARPRFGIRGLTGRVGPLAVLAAGGLLWEQPVWAASAPSKLHVITVEGMQFHPQTLIVARGDRVRWINKDLFPHTATASAGAFDSHNIDPQESWTFVAQTPGDYAYVCKLHPTMSARLIVRAAPEPVKR